jgi:hypothetical protein
MTRARPGKQQESKTVETMKFDGIAKTLGSSITRRSALRGLVASAAAAVAGGALLQADDASARRRRRKNRKGTQQSKGRQPGSFCDFSSQCQTDKGYICEVAVNAGNSDKTCSGGQGAFCGPKNDDLDDTAPFCAVGHECVNSVCQKLPDEI